MPAKKKFEKLKLNPIYSEKAQDTEQKKKLPKKEDEPDKDINEAKKTIKTYSFRPTEKLPERIRVYSVGFIDVYLAFLGAFVLALINAFLTSNGAYAGMKNEVFLTLQCIIYPIIFVVPAMVYCRMTKKSILKELSIHRFSPSYIPFIIIGLLLLTLVIAAEKMAIVYTFPTNGTSEEIYLAGEENKVGIIWAYAVFPAVCEELFFRGLIQNEISKKAGGLAGIIISALTFALIHFDLRFFIVYLSSGIILAVCAHVTNSVIPCIGIHILNNLFSLTFSARLSFIASERTGNIFIIIALVFFILLVMLFYLRSLESLSLKKAAFEEKRSKKRLAAKAPEEKEKEESEKDEEQEDDGNCLYYRRPFKLSSSTGYTLHKLLRVTFSPAIIIAIILFMFKAI